MSILSGNLINFSTVDGSKTVTQYAEVKTDLLSIGGGNRFNSLSPKQQWELFAPSFFPTDDGSGCNVSHVWLSEMQSKAIYKSLRFNDGRFGGYATKGTDEKREIILDPISDIWEILGDKKDGGGICALINRFGKQPLDSHKKYTEFIFFESDSLSLVDQIDLINKLAQNGLIPSSVVFSGSNSYHVSYRIERCEDWDKWGFTSKLFAHFGGDPNVLGRSRQLMRVPGFYRAYKEKKGVRIDVQKWQTLEFLATPPAYSLDYVAQVIQATLADLGIVQNCDYQEYKKTLKVYDGESGKARLDYLQTIPPTIFSKLLETVVKDLEGTSIGKDSYSYTRNLFWGLCHVCGAELTLDYFQASFPRQRPWATLAKQSEKYDKNGIPSIIDGMEFLTGQKWELPQFFADALDQAKAKDSSFDIEKWQAKKRDEWKELKKLTTSDKVEEKFVSNLDLDTLCLDGKIILIKSMLGTGKSTLIMRIMNRFYRNIGAFYGTHRNTLGLNFQATSIDPDTKKETFIHIRFDDSEYIKNDPTAWLLGCLDSFRRVPLDWWEGKIIILDEVVSVLNHLLFSATIQEKRITMELLETFAHIIRVSRGILCLDGHLADYIVKFFDAMKGDKELKVIDNIYTGGRPEIIFLRGGKRGEKLNENDNSPLVSNMLETIKTRPIIVFSDNKAYLKKLAKKLRNLGYKGFEMNQDTSRSKDVLDFLKDRKGWIEANQPDFILISPSAESGVDINIDGYFGGCYCVFFGILGTDSQKQFMMRLRDITIPRYVWISKFCFSIDNANTRYDENHILAQMLLEMNLNGLTAPGDILASLSDFISSLEPAYWDLLRAFHTISQHEKYNLRQAFLESVKEGGYKVTEIDMETNAELAAELRAIGKEIKDSDAIALATASDKFMGKTDSRQLTLDELNDPAMVWAYKKALLCKPFPGINRSELWGDDLVKFLLKEPFLHSKRRRYILAKNLDLAKRYSLKKAISNIPSSGIAPYQLKADLVEARALADSGILGLIASGEQYNADSPKVKEIVKYGAKKSAFTAIGKRPTDPVKYINQLLTILGFTYSSKNVKEGGEVNRVYSISTKNDAYLALADGFIYDEIEFSVSALDDSPRFVKKEQVILWQGQKCYVVGTGDNVLEGGSKDFIILATVSDFTLIHIPINEFPYSLAA